MKDTPESPDDRKVSMDELHELWDQLKARGELWNGMTDHYLHERYGHRTYHVRGVGWFVRRTAEEAGCTCCQVRSRTIWPDTATECSRCGHYSGSHTGAATLKDLQ